MQKTMKKTLSIILAILMIVTTIPFAFAADVVKSGNCGANGGNVKWTLDSDGTLTISGTGDMATFANLSQTPWYKYTNDIKKIIIEDGVTSIADYTAYGCFVATSISIGKDVKSIGPSVTTFYCRDLETITVSEDNEYYKSVDNVLFSKDGKELLKVAPKALSGTYNVPDGVVKIDKQAFNVCPYIEKVVLPDSVEEIGDWAFYQCKSLKILDIGMAKISSVGEDIFANIHTSVEVIADKDNEYVSVVNGSLFSKIDGTLFYACVTDNKCVVPYGVKIIPEYTIHVEDGSLVVPDTVETIERDGINAFDSVVHYLGTESQFQEIYEGDMSDFGFEWQGISFHYCVQQSNIPASCTDDGVTEWYCSTCDETIKYVTGYAFGHDIVEVDAKAPTCTEIGWDAYEYCTACDFTTKVEIPVDADAHNFEDGKCACGYKCPHEWGEGVLTRPTRTEEGYYTYTCSICKDTKIELVERASNYAEFKELLEKVKDYLDENLTDSMMQEVNNVINFFDLDENHRFIKGEENTVSQKIIHISEFVEVVEEGIADGTALKVNGNAIVNKMVDEWAEKIEAEGLVDAYIEFVNNNKATEEAKAEDEEIMKFAKSLEGSVAENADNIKQLEGMVSEFLACFENCLSGAHNVREYEVIEAAKCGENAVEEGACWFCGEIVTREAEDTALRHSFTKYEETEAPKCGVEGKEVAVCDNGCGETDEKAIEALTHTDADGDYICDNGCGHEFEKPAPEEPTPDTPDEPTDEACDHLCHKGGFMGFIWKIVKFFSKLFKINPVCECGAAHY